VEASPIMIRGVGLLGLNCRRRLKGAIFCHVERIRAVVRSRPWRTSGIQVCKGARPILSPRAMIIIMVGRGCVICVISHWPVSQALVVEAKRSIAAAVACARKYLVVASTARGWWCCAIRGIIASVLISSPIQARSQWELVTVTNVPRPRPKIKVAKM